MHLLHLNVQARSVRKHNKSVPCVTYDQPLWLKATKIIQEEGLPIVCRLGFHTLISFLGSMGTMMKNNGLAESFETAYREHRELGKNRIKRDILILKR